MAVESPAWANQASSYNAEQTRRAVFAAYARTAGNNPGILAGGLIGATDLQLSAPVSGMSVNVSTGEAIIGGSEVGAQGGYYARATSQTNLTISAANATNPRIDTVVATISDAGYTEPTGGSGNQWALQVITGTPTAGATLSNLLGVGTVPLSSLLLGYVLVPATATNIVTADITNKAIRVALQVGLGTNTAARGYRNAALTINASPTKVPVDTKDFDTGSNLDTTTNFRYNVPTPGYYLVTGEINLSASQSTVSAFIYKNGALARIGSQVTGFGTVVGDVMQCASGDYIELWGQSSVGQAIATGSSENYLSVVCVG